MEWCAARLTDSYNSSYMGLPTRGAALAVISRLKLYSARPLFNGNSLYRRVLNPDGTPLFPESADPQKWVAAAKAAKAVIDMGVYSLYRSSDNNPYMNYYGIMQEEWNKEIIFCGGGYQSRYTLGVHTAPGLGVGGTAYGGWGPRSSRSMPMP